MKLPGPVASVIGCGSRRSRCKRQSIWSRRRAATLSLMVVVTTWGILAAADEEATPDAAAAPAAGPGSMYSRPIRFEVRVGAWLPQTRTNQKTDNSADDRINFRNLDVTPDNAFPVGEVAIVLFGHHRFRAEYWDSTSSGRTFLNRNITFNGTLFPSGSNIESTVEASATKFGYELLLINAPEMRLGVGGGAQIFSSKSQIQLTSSAVKSTRQDERTIWFLSGNLAIDVSFLELFANVDALSYDRKSLFDGRAGAAIQFEFPPGSPLFSFGGGADWRVWNTKIEDSDIDAEWTVQGLELFLFVRF